VLAGGVGAARFLRGLYSLIDPRRLTIVVNTGDDEEFFGLHVSPDVDTILYTLAGIVAPGQGWGIRGDSYVCLDRLTRFYPETWFQLGDRDLATHIFRTDALRRGQTLSEVCATTARALRVRAQVLPMSDDAVRTFVTVRGKPALPFQRYLVHGRGRGHVLKIETRCAQRARPAPGVCDALDSASCIILPPSNPFVSIGPILALRGVKQALRRTTAPIIAISPIVAGAPIKGPLHHMLRGFDHEVSPVGVAKLYRGLIDAFVLDQRDAKAAPRIAALGIQPIVADTIMTTRAKSAHLAQLVLDHAAALNQASDSSDETRQRRTPSARATIRRPSARPLPGSRSRRG